MHSQTIGSIQALFQSRLTTLEHLLNLAQTHFNGSELFLQQRLAVDMHPFGTQIAFTCNQPRNFALWCDGKPPQNLDPQVDSLAQAYGHIANTKKLLSSIDAEDAMLAEVKRIDLSEGIYFELAGTAYVNEFLMSNLYFNMVTAYAILRMAGVPIGKQDYMMHLVPFVRQA